MERGIKNLPKQFQLSFKRPRSPKSHCQRTCNTCSTDSHKPHNKPGHNTRAHVLWFRPVQSLWGTKQEKSLTRPLASWQTPGMLAIHVPSTAQETSPFKQRQVGWVHTDVYTHILSMYVYRLMQVVAVKHKIDRPRANTGLLNRPLKK